MSDTDVDDDDYLTADEEDDEYDFREQGSVEDEKLYYSEEDEEEEGEEEEGEEKEEDDGKGDSHADLTNVGTIFDNVTSQTVTHHSYQVVNEGQLTPVPVSGLPSTQGQLTSAPVSGLPSTQGQLTPAPVSRLATSKADPRRTAVQYNFIKVEQQVTVPGAKNLNVGGSQNIGKAAPVQEDEEPDLTVVQKLRHSCSRQDRPGPCVPPSTHQSQSATMTPMRICFLSTAAQSNI